jgi:hypothetical protein
MTASTIPAAFHEDFRGLYRDISIHSRAENAAQKSGPKKLGQKKPGWIFQVPTR